MIRGARRLCDMRFHLSLVVFLFLISLTSADSNSGQETQLRWSRTAFEQPHRTLANSRVFTVAFIHIDSSRRQRHSHLVSIFWPFWTKRPETHFAVICERLARFHVDLSRGFRLIIRRQKQRRASACAYDDAYSAFSIQV
jgi:hypothetical protein